MLWILQNNFVTPMTAPMAIYLRESGKRLLDFSVPIDDGLPARVLDAVREAKGHFIYGSTALERRVCASPELSAGQLQDLALLDPKVWLQHRKGQLVNEDVERLTLGELKARAPKSDFFVKPALEQKAFIGQVVKGGDLSVVYLGRGGARHDHLDSLLVDVSPVLELTDEYRFVVFRGQVVTGSQYRNASGSYIQEVACKETLAKAAELAKGWMPAEVSVMDVGLARDGSARIIEFNSIHSAGHYAMSRPAICEAIQSLGQGGPPSD